jgi:hypothetical protein
VKPDELFTRGAAATTTEIVADAGIVAKRFPVHPPPPILADNETGSKASNAPFLPLCEIGISNSAGLDHSFLLRKRESNSIYRVFDILLLKNIILD